MKITDTFTILLDSSYDSASAPQFQKELFELVESMKPELTDDTLLVLDASELTYISSAGLRVLLMLKKEHDTIEIINVSPEVYEIFDVTGFTSIIKIRRTFREIDITGAEEIGHGCSCQVYRLNDDKVVKVFMPGIPLWKIEREADNAKKSFLFGIPCVISYDLVKCNDGYGLVFEYLKSRGVSRILNDDPSKFDEYVDKYFKLLRETHSTQADDSFEEIKPLWLKWANDLKEFYTDEEFSILQAVIDAVPDCNTIVHSDTHVNNVLEQNGELVFVDMADVGRGHPIFDIGPLMYHYHYMTVADRDMCNSAVVLREDMRDKMYNLILERYLYDPDPERHAALKEIYDCFGVIRCALIAAKHAHIEKERKQLLVNVMKENFYYRADRLLELMKKYL